jgi:Heparinase II/III-like protein
MHGMPAIRRTAIGVACAAALAAGCLPAPSEAPTGAPLTIRSVAELSLARPRIVARSGDIAVVQSRVSRVPYSLLIERMDAQIAAAPAPSLADQAACGVTANIAREESKARAAKDLAFLYLINRTWDATTKTVVTPTTAARDAMGDRARDYLVASCITSRIRIQPDRDINTSNEMIQMATAYDTLKGAGYDFGTSEATVVANLVSWASDFYNDYQPFLNFLTNNHLAKGAASIGTVALALYGSPGVDSTMLDTWLNFGLVRVEQVVRYTLGSGDGTYGEGPFYWRYASQNVVPFARAYDSLSGGAAWQTASGSRIESIWRSRWFTEIGRWELDMTRPDGTLVPIDDGNVDDAYYFGALPSTSKYASAYAWRWANAAALSASVPYESGGSVDMSADSIVTFDDAIVPAPPTGSPNRLYGAGGNLVFRSNWNADAVAAFVQAEHGGSRGFGRTPGSGGIPFAAVHDHADPGSFMLDAYGERLLLDPGYINYTWTLHGMLADPSAHNLVLVGPATDPQSPGNPNTASTVPTPELDAFVNDPNASVPVDGEAFVSNVVNERGLAAATVTARYGRDPNYVAPSPLTAAAFQELDSSDAATVQRRFIFVDKRFLVIADAVSSVQPRTYSWPMHGNGGGADGVTAPRAKLDYFDKMFEPAAAIPATPYSASGGVFAATANGGLWERSLARVNTAMASDQPGPMMTSTSLGLYEQTHGRLGSNTVLTTSLAARNANIATVVYPSRTSGAAPTTTTLSIPGAAVLRVSDPATKHEILVIVRAAGLGAMTIAAGVSGMPVSVTTDAAIAVVDVRHDGSVSKLYSEGGTTLTISK